MVICALMVTAIITRLVVLQVLDHAHYTTLSQNNRLSLQPLVPTRGLIYDRNGVVLAQNIPTYILKVIPEQVENLDQTLDELGKMVEISEHDRERFIKLRKRSRPFKAIPLRFRLTDEEVAKFAVNRHRYPGVDIEAELTRHYPLGALAAHSIGYVGRIDEAELQKVDVANYDGTSHIGKTGVERYYEDILHGQVGHQEVETNAQGRILRVLRQTLPTPGQNLHLNIDARLQKAATEAFGEDNGALVAIEPSTGAVLALVSVPMFDPNLFVNGIDPKTYKQLISSPDQPLYNRTLHGQYPPGSTTKPFLGLASLEVPFPQQGAQTFCPGWYKLEGDERRYRDWKKVGHGLVNLDKAIVQSCDVFFYELSFNMGIDRIEPYMRQWGFGEATGIDIGGEQKGLMPSRQWKRKMQGMPWFPGETLITGIGQGYMLATPLQLAAITATLANQGMRNHPRMVSAIQDPLSKLLSPLEVNIAGKVEIKNPDNLQSIIRSMTRVVHSITGTAKSINQDLNYRIAGKTGTAQVFGIKQDETYKKEEIKKKLQDHALFIGFAPAQTPEIAIAAIVENGGSGGAVAAPLVRKVMDAYMAYNEESNR